MASYKVPQDVEAEDKLIGPFSFRQFIYLVIACAGIGAAWGLAQLFVFLAIIPLPIVFFFGLLALPLRKDQPTEIYLAAIISFYLKPRQRLWDPDGIESLIEITVPKEVEVQRVKDISRDEAGRRFGYLAEIVDSEGWAIRGQGVQNPNNAMSSDAYYAAQQTPDVFDTNNNVVQSFDYMINQSDARHHEDMIAKMTQIVAAPVAPQPVIAAPVVAPMQYAAPVVDPTIPTPMFNPYPNDIHQTVIQPPADDQAHQLQIDPVEPAPAPYQPPEPVPTTTSEKPVSPGIMELANNTDLSIETMAREANRINKKEADLNEEVVISLR